MNKPDFIIIGAAKSGTTTIYEYLSLHPDIYLTTPKEPDFFSLNQHYDRGIEHYQSLFTQAQENQICGEASTTYSRLQRYPETVSRIAQYLPSVKFIYIMRHPINRAYSFYSYRFKGSRTNCEFLASRNELMKAKTFEEAIQQTSEFIDSSLYLDQIEKYLEYYPRESFLFLFIEDLISNPQETVTKIFDFLEVDVPADFFAEKAIVSNQRNNFPDWYVKKQLTSKLKQNPLSNKLLKIVPKNLKNIIYQTWKQKNYQQWQEKESEYLPPPMLAQTRKMLLERFHEPNQKLSQFLGQSFSLERIK